jgi:hypothetical protein
MRIILIETQNNENLKKFYKAGQMIKIMTIYKCIG